MNSPRRFSKDVLLTEIERRIEFLMTWNQFDRYNGTAQLAKRSQDAILDYGKLEALRSLRDDIVGGNYTEWSAE